MQISNFLFHRVNPEKDKLWPPMEVPLFERCIKHISRNYTVVLMEDIVAGKLPANNKKKLATIQFDDGYKDNIDYALPILDKYNCKASFYIVTDCIDYNIPTWTYIFDYSFQHTGQLNIDMSFEYLPDAFKTKGFNSAEERLGYAARFKPYMKTLTHEQREEVLQKIKTTFSDVELPRIMMNWDDVKRLKNEGHYIGSHTVTHSLLGTMKNSAVIRNELRQSADRINEMLGYFPATISYPNGSYSSTTMQIAKEEGYTAGLALKYRPYNTAAENVFEISRIELYNEPWLKTLLRMKAVLQKIKKLYSSK